MFPGQEWFQNLIDAINESREYADAAATWEGDVAFVIEAEPDRGVPEDVWAYLDLWHGECRGGGIVDAGSGAEARFVIRAPYTRWKDVIEGELDPIRGMMQGKLRLQGDLPTIIRHVRAANELVQITGTLDTQFVDEG